MLDWKNLFSIEQLDEIDRISEEKPCLIFKHSTRCSLSDLVLKRFENNWDVSSELIPIYFLDLVQYRQVSNHIAERYSVEHESPQVLLIEKGSCIFAESHLDIDTNELKDTLFTVK
ncbi:MAG: bacillithiol system redox-active protein YtxJ [Saprospiraceae bacterium]|nr:bacillithiol system redox-active protein YtxJ [Saprospiraceae bacterium]